MSDMLSDQIHALFAGLLSKRKGAKTQRERNENRNRNFGETSGRICVYFCLPFEEFHVSFLCVFFIAPSRAPEGGIAKNLCGEELGD